MLSLSPAKLLVILVVGLIVLGPDKLPQMARQLGAFWHDIRLWRGRIENEVRDTFPNLPPTHEVARVVRSPLAFLDRLADEHERTLDEDATGVPEDSGGGDGAPPGPEGASGADGSRPRAPTPASNGSAPATRGPATPGGSDGPRRAGRRVAGPGAGPGTVSADDPSMN